MSEQMTQVKGSIIVRNPTQMVLEVMFGFLIEDHNAYPPVKMARLVMKQIGTPADIQIAPGLRAVVGTKDGEPAVRLKWESCIGDPDDSCVTTSLPR